MMQTSCGVPLIMSGSVVSVAAAAIISTSLVSAQGKWVSIHTLTLRGEWPRGQMDHAVGEEEEGGFIRPTQDSLIQTQVPRR